MKSVKIDDTTVNFSLEDGIVEIDGVFFNQKENKVVATLSGSSVTMTFAEFDSLIKANNILARVYNYAVENGVEVEKNE